MSDIEQIKNAIRDVAIAHGAEKAILFGSLARGSATRHSDVDVIFIEQTSARFLDRLGKYMDALWTRLQLPVEVFVYTPEEFESISWKPFIQKALNEGIVVYEHRKAA